MIYFNTKSNLTVVHIFNAQTERALCSKAIAPPYTHLGYDVIDGEQRDELRARGVRYQTCPRCAAKA